VWSDGTGVGLKIPGRVNHCLFSYFADIARDLECEGLCWDAICIPEGKDEEGKKQKREAINNMLENFKEAKYTVVHDLDLMELEWREDGSPAIALILSSWFTRGWTAAELFSSRRVKVLFKNSSDGTPLIKDLNKDILPWIKLAGDSPKEYPSLGHLVASDIIGLVHQLTPDTFSWDQGNLSQDSMQLDVTAGLTGILTFKHLMRVLRQRTTSWASDRILIAG
jgi:hypothetical protein